jgi:hypothetical protein
LHGARNSLGRKRLANVIAARFLNHQISRDIVSSENKFLEIEKLTFHLI